MVIRRKKSFHRLLGLLRSIEADQSNLEAVRLLNIGVIKEIVRAENSIARHKLELKELNASLKTGRGSKERSLRIRHRQRSVASYIKAREDQIYIWKSFGDALAFIYLDKFSIKHAFFDTEQPGIKRGAGLLTGKDGLAAEITCLFDALEHGVPAVLCDITNTIRYGDVCLLGASDPFLIEVKSSAKGSQRRQRQMDKLKSLHDFLETDKAENFRGNAGVTRRVNMDISERNHIAELENCITMAKANGQHWVQPETGITYVAVYTHLDVERMPSAIGGAVMVHMLNADKNDHAWAPYVPFLLTIRSEEQLLDFIEGRVSLLVMIDAAQLCRLMAVDGWIARSRPTADYVIECLHPESGSFVSLSGQFVSRAAYEFVSLEWIAELHLPSVEKLFEFAASMDAPTNPKTQKELLLERLGPDDEWLDLIS
jgi:hypothetical protein